METIKQAKDYLRANWAKGVVCPCCTQFVKLYKRKLNSGMAITLIRIYRYSMGWVPVKDFLRLNKWHNGHDWTLLRFWGLMEEKQHEPGENSSGQWKITAKGINFVLNQTTVPKRLLMYNQSGYGFEGGETSITEALGNKFNYQELMAA